MIKGKVISLIIPCRNEGKGIAKLIKSLPAYIDDVIVVDNKSKDNTFSQAKLAGARVFKETRSVNGIGYGYAHQTGLKHALGDYIFAMDGDGTYPAKKIKDILKFMKQYQLDVVSCNRLPLDNLKAISSTRRLGIQILNWEIALLFGYPIKDTLTGMWGIKRDAVKKLNLSEGGWDLSPEIKLKSIKHPQIKYAEFHIDHFERDDTSVSKQKIWETGFNHFVYILRMRFTAFNPVFQPTPWRLAATKS